MTYRQRKTIANTARSFTLDMIYRDGIEWLARNTKNDDPQSQAIQLLAHLTDTADEWILQHVSHRQNEIEQGIL